MALANKPAFNVNPSNLTDSIVSSSQQGVKDYQSQQTTKAVNAYGVTVLRGGNTLGSSFIDGIIDAYTNIVSYRPFALFLMIIGTLYFMSVAAGTTDPFTATHKHVLAYHSKATNAAHKNFMAAFAGILSWIINYKEFFALLSCVTFPYLSKPSSRNAYISAILLVYCLLFGLTPAAIIALAHLFFLMVQLRNPLHKTIIVIIAIVVIFLGHETITKLSGMK